MNAPDPDTATSSSESLETVELELALRFQDLISLGFEGALEQALAAVGGEVLFHLPADFLPDCQRVAAVSTGNGEERRIFLVMLSENGEAMRIEDAGESDSPIADLAASYAGVMDRMASDQPIAA